MTAKVIALCYGYNEGDILPYTLKAIVDSDVDSIFIADDESQDNSWNIIQDFKKEYPDRIELIRRQRIKGDKGQKNALLQEVRRRYNPEDIWVQVQELDIAILDTSVKDAIATHAVHDMAVSWQLMNGVRKDWSIDTYPNWPMPVQELLPYWHYSECMLYTFRPLPGINFTEQNKPWPRGFKKYINGPAKVDKRTRDAPLLIHYGYRGPTHFHLKYKKHGKRHPKYSSWDLSSRETILKTVPFFNGQWNKCRFPVSRDGWIEWRKSRRR